MKKNIWEFCKRGMMFAWGGPAIVALAWYIIWKVTGEINLTVPSVVLGIVSTILLAFFAAGVSVVNQIESLPKTIAALIQGSVLLIDYLVVYLINGWISLDKVWIFVVCFLVCFVAIWGIVYLSVRAKVSKINKVI